MRTEPQKDLRRPASQGVTVQGTSVTPVPGRDAQRTALSREGGSGGKESACNAKDPGSIRVSGRLPGGGNG